MTETKTAEETLREIASIAWKGAANAFRMYPDNSHTFAQYWNAAKNQFDIYKSSLQSKELAKDFEDLKNNVEEAEERNRQLEDKIAQLEKELASRAVISIGPVETECSDPCHTMYQNIKVFKCATVCAGLNNCKLKMDF